MNDNYDDNQIIITLNIIILYTHTHIGPLFGSALVAGLFPIFFNDK